MSKTDRLTLAFEQGHFTISQNTVVLRATARSLYSNFSELIAVQSFKPIYDTLIKQGLNVQTTIPDNAQDCIIELTRSKYENLGMISIGYSILPIGGRLIIDGIKTDGIESILKTLKKILPIEGIFSKAHGKTICLRKEFDSFTQQDIWRDAADISKNSDGWYTMPGMFSVEHIDPGSQLLVEHIPNVIFGKCADLGAGWGWLATKILQKYPKITSLDLIEAEKLALDCAKINLTDSRAEYKWEDVTKLEINASYDFIFTNPPFHQSRKTNLDLGRSFIAKSAQMLTPRGTLFLVANKQLPYETTLSQYFTSWKSLKETSQFKVIQATRPIHNKLSHR